jgi:hypothetical protein
LVEHETGKPFEGKDLEASVSMQFRIREQLSLNLKRGLLWGYEEQRQTCGLPFQFGTRIRQAAKSLPAARGAHQKCRAHALRLAQTWASQK